MQLFTVPQALLAFTGRKVLESRHAMQQAMRFMLAMTLSIAVTGCESRQPPANDITANTEPMETDLQIACRTYLEQGPPAHMDNYVPGSLTEIIISQGAEGESLDPELTEIAGIILLESESLSDIEDPAIRDYMQNGADLVRRVLEANE